MNRTYFFPSLLIVIWLLSACRPSHSTVVSNHFVSPQAVCNGRMAWSAEITTDDVVVYSTFWLAFDAETVQDHFKYVQVEVTLDGRSVVEQMKFVQAPEPYSVTCAKSGLRFEASRMRYTLILPQLSSGKHSILWKFKITADLDDGVFTYPHGMTAEYNSTLQVENYGILR